MDHGIAMTVFETVTDSIKCVTKNAGKMKQFFTLYMLEIVAKNQSHNNNNNNNNNNNSTLYMLRD